jgi:poly-gamma-glutamate synthesis protein (capsule biosynthesis protein)
VSGERAVSVLAVGDVMLGRGVSAEPDPLGDVAGWLQVADLTLGNLEVVLVDGGTPRRAPTGEAQPILLSTSPAAADSLRQAGFDILGLANNHSLDYGVIGLKETINHLQRAGLEIVGSTTENEAIVPVYHKVNGVRLAFLAFNSVPDPHRLQTCPPGKTCSSQPARWIPVEAAAAIASAKVRADAVIVSVHWGFEYEPWQDPSQEKAARIMLEAGADLIIGHHPHVVQAIAVNGDQVTAYSLGNFVFDQGADDVRQGLALRAFFDEDGLRAVQVLPVRAGSRPRLLALSEGALLLAQALPPPPRVGFACDESDCTPANIPQTELVGLFYAGQVDLTGDGLPETVRREGERITIYEKGSVVWRSPAAWRVVDAALGDPNDDGRYEVMLAIWQEDEAGYERSQPYILGHRGGVYTLLWGGRPVVDPIRELAVGDVEGDGSDELVVIEEMADGLAQAVAVWRWTGWTFSLVWRSQYGCYRDLILVEGNQTLISAVSVSSKASCGPI